MYFQFAEKRKEHTPEETDDGDATSDSSAHLTSAASRSYPKSHGIISSLTSELESGRGAITGAQDAAAQTG